jgi:hypothetical protein
MIKNFKIFIKENIVDSPNKYNTITPYEDYFNEIQDCMKKILIKKGFTPEKAELLITNDPYSETGNENPSNTNEEPGLIIQFPQKIKKEIKSLYNKKTTPEEAANYFIENYMKKTLFNMKGNEKEPNRLNGDRGTNSIDSF